VYRLPKRLERLLSSTRRKPATPLHGHPHGSTAMPFVDALSDDDLERLNGILDWQAFVTDARGRRFGSVAWEGKRDLPQAIPDERIVLLDRLVELSDKRVLEVGCFEGIHTAALVPRSKRVVAVDARIENVVKTIVRCALLDLHPTVHQHDLDDPHARPALPETDVLHHVGVFYHLADPTGHLRRVAPLVSHAILLDTHFALAEEATDEAVGGGRAYRFKRQSEGGRADAFSGMQRDSKWMLLSDIEGLLAELGFGNTLHREVRQERNGPRVLLVVARRR
jgi:tRNA (mo5U34)-methyltransferase